MSDDPRQDDREAERPTIAAEALAIARAAIERARAGRACTPEAPR